jgi:uncharacterized protein YecE (DUF72 family)
MGRTVTCRIISRMKRREFGRVRIGVAGWSIPKGLSPRRLAGNSLLERYGALFDAAEINSSFYRPHQKVTYERWSASVPDSFRFAVKVPRLITHERRLESCNDDIAAFMNAAQGLGDKLGALLVQLPPSGAFNESVSREFFRLLRQETSALIACEARHPSWFTLVADQLLGEFHVTRVTADPPPRGCEVSPPKNLGSRYLRLHGSPHIYYSPYAFDYLQQLSSVLERSDPIGESWCIFDNTAAGAAWSDAQTLQRLLGNNQFPAHDPPHHAFV